MDSMVSGRGGEGRRENNSFKWKIKNRAMNVNRREKSKEKLLWHIKAVCQLMTLLLRFDERRKLFTAQKKMRSEKNCFFSIIFLSLSPFFLLIRDNF